MIKLTPLHPPVSASDCQDWAKRVRSAVKRDGQAVRAGVTLTIEAKSLIDNNWRPITLPGNGSRFASAKDRDEVLRLVVE